MGVRDSDEPPVTQEEIKTMMQQGAEAGIFEEAEQDMISGVFRLGDRRVNAIMTPRTEVVWLNLLASEDENRAKISESKFSRMPVCNGDADHVVGILDAKCLLGRMTSGEVFDIKAAMTDVKFVPESMLARKVLDVFRRSSQHIAIVIGEYGGMEGLITVQDILEEIVGEVEEAAPQATQREDGSWLIDGLMLTDDFKKLFNIDLLPGEHESYTTLGGFVMAQIGNIPKASDSFQWETLRFEVMDMDGNRVDKVLVTNVEPVSETALVVEIETVSDAETGGEKLLVSEIEFVSESNPVSEAEPSLKTDPKPASETEPETPKTNVEAGKEATGET